MKSWVLITPLALVVASLASGSVAQEPPQQSEQPTQQSEEPTQQSEQPTHRSTEQQTLPPVDRPTQPPKHPSIYDTYDFPEYPDPDPYGPPATMAIYFDLVRRTRSCHVEPNTPFQFFVVAHDSQVAVRGWEAKIIIDPRVKILSKKFTGLNVGQGDDWYVGLRPEECLAGETVVLVEFTAMVVDDSLSDLVLGIGPTDRSSFHPPSPGYLLCRPSDELQTYAACDTCAVVNPLHIQIYDDSVIRDMLEPAKGR